VVGLSKPNLNQPKRDDAVQDLFKNQLEYWNEVTKELPDQHILE